MMVRQTLHPAINAAATIANRDGFAVAPCEAMSQRKQIRARAGRVIALSAEKFDKQKMRVTSSFLFVRHSTHSYDELLAAVPIRPRPCMMLGMINTPDILSIGENAHACKSSVAGDPSASAADNSSLPSRSSAGGC